MHYRRPGLFTRHVFNRIVRGLTRLGISVWGSRVLEVRGRKSGLPRQTPVNLLTFNGRQYLVSPRGETEWVRNVRADGGKLDLLDNEPSGLDVRIRLTSDPELARGSARRALTV